MATEVFVDDARIAVASGAGGDGFVGYRREKFEPHGGPDGGDGGRGGDVILVADPNQNTLLGFRARREFRAQNGQPGGGSGRTGADGADVEIRVPVGTVVLDAAADDDDAPLVDLSISGQRFRLLRGGRGGRGNAYFKNSRRQTPDFAQSGAPGSEKSLHLSLKLLADVGLIGFPNAGKSTLIRAISAARPRVAAYPFTTLVPTLGVVEIDERRFVVADIPGLIEGASDGVGLGDRFLRHVERTRVLVHLLDLGAMLLEDRDPLADYEAVRKELGRYRPELLERREIVLLNKTDLCADGSRSEEIAALEAELVSRGRQVLRASAATSAGTKDLVVAMARALDDAKEADAAAESAQ